MKSVSKLILIVITIFLLGVVNINASDISIIGSSVFRKSAQEATFNFISNSDGIVYYTVSENNSASLEDLNEFAGNITKNVTKTFIIPDTLLSSGAKYIHVVVKDSLNNYSNILTISMPNDIYYFDDFEAYKVASYPAFFEIKANGSNTAEQKVILSTSGNKVFNVFGTYGTGLDERVQIPAISTGYAVLEADIIATNITDDYYFGGLTMGFDNSYTRNIIVQVNYNDHKFTAISQISNISLEINKKYHVEIVVNVENKTYDYYVDGVKANTSSINAEIYDKIRWFGIYSGSGTVNYDNIKFYSQSSNPNNYLITKRQTTNGTFSIDKTYAKMNDIVTINTSPDEGYRVKFVKINNSESGITKVNDNYTFRMPESNVEVTIEFEKIPYTITVNSVIGATITPNGTISVLYGDNKEFAISADFGYEIISVKANGIEKLPSINGRIAFINISLTNIKEDQTIVIIAKKIEYDVTDGAAQKHIIGKNEDSIFRINASKLLFDKLYLNDEVLDSNHYIVTEGSTIITLKQDYLNHLLPGTYNLKATFTDGGTANTTFVIAEAEENNPRTGDSILFSIILGIVSLISLSVVGLYFKIEFNK